ncbi:MAG: menaquinone-dependent protoporphyrinogen IX dehydrogenase [Gammaproteobacteria bacterium]|nr:menaquinone-dependent protoporphyrinogen IX dehydrogenase [Gammaproteobacteria bacterium]
MARIVFIYSTVDGHTLEICERLRQVVTREGHQASLHELTEDSDIDLEPFDRIVIGASVRYGKHRPRVTRFIEENVHKLETTPSAFFSVNAVARKPEKREAQSNPYVRKFLKKITWKPPVIAIFGGKIDYPIYRFWDKTMIRFIMWMTNGPTDPNATFDFTDWEEVETFGQIISTND